MGEFRWRLAEDDGGQPALFSDDELLDRHVGKGEFRGMEFLHVNARRIINEVPAASRMPFRFTINAYRGCSHACSYCFARPTHEYLNLNIADDFEKKIVVKVNAVERLRAELRSPKWLGDHIAMGTNTDPYQRCEGKYHLTRGVIEALSDARNPFSILTKSTLILRDLDVLSEANQRTSVKASFSIGTLDEEVWRRHEPGTPHPRKRVEAVAKLTEAGIETGVLVAPILPGISDHPDQLDAVVKACVDAGAASISTIYLHLRPGVRQHFLADLRRDQPELAAEYARKYKRAYLPTTETRRLGAQVSELIQDHGGLRSKRRRRTSGKAATATPKRRPPPEQLSFT